MWQMASVPKWKRIEKNKKMFDVYKNNVRVELGVSYIRDCDARKNHSNARCGLVMIMRVVGDNETQMDWERETLTAATNNRSPFGDHAPEMNSAKSARLALIIKSQLARSLSRVPAQKGERERERKHKENLEIWQDKFRFSLTLVQFSSQTLSRHSDTITNRDTRDHRKEEKQQVEEGKNNFVERRTGTLFLGRPLERHWSGSWACPSLLYSFALYTDAILLTTMLTSTPIHCVGGPFLFSFKLKTRKSLFLLLLLLL